MLRTEVSTTQGLILVQTYSAEEDVVTKTHLLKKAVFLWNDEFSGVSLSEEDYEKYVKNELAIAKDMEQRYTLDKLKSMKIDFNKRSLLLRS